MKEVFGIISDDLTGAADTVVQFSLQNLPGVVVFQAFELPPAINAVAVDSSSRGLSEKDVVAALIQSVHILKCFPITSLYKKIDSTLRGHLALEIETLLDLFDMELALVAPAYPANARTTVDGYQLVAQTPVAESGMGHDPIWPVYESHLPTLFRRTSRLKVGHISLTVLQDGLHAVQKTIRHLRTEGVQIIICDATTPEHLTILADFLCREPGVLACGSAGLAKAIAFRLSPPRAKQAQNRRKSPFSASTPPVLIVAGSCSQITVGQIEEFRSHKKTVGISISPEHLLHRRSDFSMKDIIADITESLEAGYDTVLHLTQNSSASGTLGCGRRLADRLGGITLNILQKPLSLSGLILTGGDIAKAVCEHLELDGIELHHELYPAVPVGRCLGGGIRPGLNIITKGGGCGSEDILSGAVSYLKDTFLQES
ncbi:MAG: four-carbon acid sugar kinase family protein [bacterium]|nr:four-carbon acid sugar kinase family protein [bacterium]